MANGVVFKVTDPRAPRLAVQQNVAEITARIASAAASNTPRLTGAMAAGWEVRPGYSDPGTSVVTNRVPYARFVEYGTRRMRAHAPLGRALASGGA
ncbi:MAG TPA: HK97 gp10 family phage protein [Solirubrobacteraceae bacterium]|nr:HK97 gp10 family phage protein [Solirubrobacteraceae bacterium]